jgi:hypothetical protein
MKNEFDGFFEKPTDKRGHGVLDMQMRKIDSTLLYIIINIIIMKFFSNIGIGIGKISIKNIIATRAYCSNFASAVSDEFIIDCPYQIINTIQSNGIDIYGHNAIDIRIGAELSLLIAFIIYSYYHRMPTNNTIQRLYEFIDYRKIELQTRNLFIIMAIVLFRNVQNAI